MGLGRKIGRAVDGIESTVNIAPRKGAQAGSKIAGSQEIGPKAVGAVGGYLVCAAALSFIPFVGDAAAEIFMNASPVLYAARYVKDNYL